MKISGQKSLWAVIIINLLFLVLLGVVSFRFLTEQLKRAEAVQPEILAQYTVSLEVGKLLEIKQKLIDKKIN